jgi:hypothetical protein
MKVKIALTTTLSAIAGLAFYVSSTAFAQQTPEPGKEPKHPPIIQALDDLNHAKMELQEAKGNFGGHRGTALNACNQAISECKLAISFKEKESH